MMKLYYFPIAPNPTKVRLYLAEKAAAGTAIDVEEVRVDLTRQEQKSAEHLARNPFGNLPVLEIERDSYLLESLAIIEYLEDLHPEPAMIGRDPLERARVREIERIAEMGVLLPVARIIHATNSPLGLPPVPEMAAFFRKTLPAALDVLDRRLADGRPFAAGERVSIADFTLQAALQFARFGKLEIDPAYEQLARWDREYRARPAAASVLTM